MRKEKCTMQNVERCCRMVVKCAMRKFAYVGHRMSVGWYSLFTWKGVYCTLLYDRIFVTTLVIVMLSTWSSSRHTVVTWMSYHRRRHADDDLVVVLPSCRQPTSSTARCYFPHLDYAVYHSTSWTWHAVNCVIAAVMWSDLSTNHRRSAFCIPHFTFHIPQLNSTQQRTTDAGVWHL